MNSNTYKCGMCRNIMSKMNRLRGHDKERTFSLQRDLKVTERLDKMFASLKNSVGLKNGKEGGEGSPSLVKKCSAGWKEHMMSVNRAKMGKPLFMLDGNLENFAVQWGGSKGIMKNKKAGFVVEKMNLMAEKEKRIEERLKIVIDKVEMLTAFAVREEVLAKVNTRLMLLEHVLSSGATLTIYEAEDDLRFCHRLLHGEDCKCRLDLKVKQEYQHLELPLLDTNVFES